MLLVLIAGCAADMIIPVKSSGFHSFALAKSDIISLDLTNRFAVFLDVPPDSFSAEFHTANNSNSAFFSLSVPAFTIRGGFLKVRCRVRRGRLKLWLLSEHHCPDPENIAIVNTDGQLRLATGFNGTICLFFPTGGYLHDIRVETGLGFPWISFFSFRGHGDVIRLCQGEEDPCAFTASDLLFMSLRGPTRINFSYCARGFEGNGFACSIEPLPRIANGLFVDTLPKIDNIAHPYCLPVSNGIGKAGRLVVLIAVGIAGCGLLGRVALRFGLLKEHAFAAWSFAKQIRKTFEDC
jgi:hypothetical protein